MPTSAPTGQPPANSSSKAWRFTRTAATKRVCLVALNSLGHLDWGTGKYAQAQERARAGLALHQARGDGREQANALTTLAWICLHIGQSEESVQLRREVLDLCQRLGDRWGQVNGTACLAFSLFWQGSYDEALHWANHSLALCLEMGQRGQEGFVRLAVCGAHLLTGHYALARREAVPALAMSREAGNAGVEATIHWALGCLALVERNYDGARSAFAESRRLYDEVQDNYLGIVLSGPGFVACAEGHFVKARQHFVEGLRFALALKDFVTLNVTLPGVALWLALTGDVARAVEVWEAAGRLPYVANSRWHADIVGQPVEAAALALAPAQREKARARGRALDLWATAEALVNELQQFERAPSGVMAALAPRPVHHGQPDV